MTEQIVSSATTPTIEQVVDEQTELLKPYQELVDHIMKVRDGYYQMVSRFNSGSEYNAINKAREELEYYEGLWNEAREICRRNNLKASEKLDENQID